MRNCQNALRAARQPFDPSTGRKPRTPAARGCWAFGRTGALSPRSARRPCTSGPHGPRNADRTGALGLRPTREAGTSRRHRHPGPPARTDSGPPTAQGLWGCGRHRNSEPPADTDTPDLRPARTPELPPTPRPWASDPHGLRTSGRTGPLGLRPAQKPGNSARHGNPWPPADTQRGARPRCGPRVRWLRLTRRGARLTSVSCLRRRSHLRHHPRRRTNRLRRTSRRRRSVPRGVRLTSRSLRPRPTSCRRCRGATTRWTPTPRDGPSVRIRRCGPWTPTPRPRGLRSPPG
ncbi:hypothetical protein SCNRRL3882_3697 [Streptomyces chartreusis NRRL 3882]|uniref:Uncharacterized protein n=1 Tax=Streptomyces chartreusis NRRL 3882 TaxID=1079985 RepID=A0A2N9BA58_STRCX|nr:hypothetical protein SCNRRL3882_3697 [Streptomyces chartreusis NRRL 3882]